MLFYYLDANLHEIPAHFATMNCLNPPMMIQNSQKNTAMYFWLDINTGLLIYTALSDVSIMIFPHKHYIVWITKSQHYFLHNLLYSTFVPHSGE